jgi:putative DNA primase/helicase
MTAASLCEAADRAPPHLPNTPSVGQSASTAPARISVVWPSSLGDFRPPPQLIKGLLFDGSLALLYGDSNTGKSTLAVDMGMSVARGALWRDKAVQQGAVFHFAGEGVAGLRQRVHAYCVRHGLDPSDVRYGILHGSFDLVRGEDVGALIEAVNASKRSTEPVRLIIVDTLARCAGIDENNGNDMRQVIAGADRIRVETGATVMLVHHTGKNPSQGARGHSSLRAAVDTELLVTDGPGGRTVSVTKQRDLAQLPAMRFDLPPVEIGTSEGEPLTACVVEHEDSAPPGQGMSGRSMSQRALIDFLAKRVGRGEALGTLSELKAMARTDLKMPRSTAQDTVKSLVRTGIIAVDKSGQCQLTSQPAEKPAVA